MTTGSVDGPAVPPLGAGGIEVRKVELPAAPSDLVPLEILVTSVRKEPVRLQIDVSRDGGASFKSARLSADSAVTGLAATPAGSPHTVQWSSLEDLGFHQPRRARLRVIAQDSQGASVPYVIDTPVIDNLRAAARHVQSYVINYETWDAASLAFAKKHDLAIVHPRNGNLMRGLVADLQAGNDPQDPADDVLVLCYLSAGEDERSVAVSDTVARADARFRGDGSGPRTDPRGPSPAPGTLAGIDPLGLPSSGGTGWASYYLDDNSVFRSPDHQGDGLPDRNSQFGGFFVNAGDPKWFEALQSFQLDGPDKVSGLREVLTGNYGRGLDCDGVFLDTIDTTSPNSYTDISSPNLCKFDWTTPGMAAFIARLRQAYPGRVIMQNRGLHYFDPNLPAFQYPTRGNIDLVLFESYRLDSSPVFNEGYYLDNRFNTAPRLMAEAARPDGFVVLSLGYAEGTGLPEARDTLLGKSTAGLDSLLLDIHVTQDLAGFRHYITDASVSLVNSFVRDHSNFDDHQPPRWTSTYNDHVYPPPRGIEEPTPRTGIQEVLPAPGGVTVRWDVALDLYRVRYALYHQTTPFDLAADPDLKKATRTILTPAMGAGYQQGTGPKVYPNQARVEGLAPGQTYYFVIRAFDSSPAANEEKNTVVLSAVAGAN